MNHKLDAFDPAEPRTEERPSLLSAPPEGWISAVALGVMLVAVGYAVDEARWVGLVRGTSVSQTAFLPLAIVLAAIVGGVLARTELRPWKAHLLGSLAGATFLLIAVAGAYPGWAALEDRLRATAWSVNAYAWESFVIGVRSNETSAFLLLVGALLWGIGQLGAFSVFRRRSAMPVIALGATALLLNMSLTPRDQLVHLAVFAGAALLLLVRLNLLTESEGWRSRRILDAGYAGELYLRRGAVFVSVAILASIVLAGTASSAPLARAWRDMDSNLLTIGYEVNRWLGGVSGPVRGETNLFGPRQRLRDTWESSTQVVFTARVGDEGSHYWRGATYDSFDGLEWQQLDPLTTLVPAGEDTLAGTAEQLAAIEARRQVAVMVTSVSLGGDYMVVPESPLVVDRTTELQAHSGDGGFVGLRMADGLREGVQYNAISLVPQLSGSGAVTANRLAAASTDYEPWLRRYLEIRPGSIGELTYAEADRIVDALPPDKRNPYHIAEAIQRWFFSAGEFEYSTDLRGDCTSADDLVDCFLEVRRGFCERFATAMTMMLRTQGIPARYVVGYLPGQRLGDDTWQVDRTASHAWVEVYFPGYGWIRFDPTPGNRENGQEPTIIGAGGPVPTARPGPLGPTPTPFDPAVYDPAGLDDDERILLPPLPGADPDMPSAAPPIALLVLLLVALALVLMVRLRRVPPVEPVRAYAGLTRLATRLGHGPRPTQTVFEFTSGLSQLVPAVASDLGTLATAKVEATYARRPVTAALSHRLGLAYRRVRLGLLRLLLRRPRWVRQPIELRRRRP